MSDDVIKLENVKIERDGGVTFVILNRPEKRNAMSPQLHVDMCEALDWAEEDTQTKVLVLTGAGGNFCAGQDLKLFFRATEDDPRARNRARRAAHTWRWDKLSRFPKATIAMVHGYCFGGGFVPVIACDFAIAAQDATFGLSEVNWGHMPGGLVAWAITVNMSYRDAIYYAVTGDQFNGQEAAAMKFVNKAVPLDRLRDETMALARKLESQERGGGPLQQGGGTLGARHDAGAGAGLPELQERCPQVHRSRKGSRQGDEDVPGRKNVQARSRRLQARLTHRSPAWDRRGIWVGFGLRA